MAAINWKVGPKGCRLLSVMFGSSCCCLPRRWWVEREGWRARGVHVRWGEKEEMLCTVGLQPCASDSCVRECIMNYR